jgi:phage terminase Nu1 subunit (DNA packaging protein)
MGVTAPAASEISAAEAARRLGMTATAVGQWCNRPGAPVRRQGQKAMVRWPDFARWREQELVRQAKAEVAPTVSLDEARTRKALAEAELAEMDLAKQRGEFVAVAAYEAALARVLDRLTARLRAMPVRVSHLGPETEAATEAEVEAVIIELSQFADDVIDEPPPDGEQRAA